MTSRMCAIRSVIARPVFWRTPSSVEPRFRCGVVHGYTGRSSVMSRHLSTPLSCSPMMGQPESSTWGVAVTNLSVYLAESANKYPDTRAVVSDAATTTYSALANDVARFADYLTDG